MDAPDSRPAAETPEPITPDAAGVDTEEALTTADSASDTARVETPVGTAGPAPQETPVQEAADRVDLGEATSEPLEPGDSCEGSTPFGAGIL